MRMRTVMAAIALLMGSTWVAAAADGVATCGGLEATIVGTSGDDLLVGTAG